MAKNIEVLVTIPFNELQQSIIKNLSMAYG